MGITLTQAARHNEFTMGIYFLIFCHLQDGIDGFGFGTFDETAGIDDNDVGMGWIISQFPFTVTDKSHHDLRINEVLRAS